MECIWQVDVRVHTLTGGLVAACVPWYALPDCLSIVTNRPGRLQFVQVTSLHI